MKNIFLVLVATFTSLLAAQATISVGAGGSGVLTFDTTPLVTEFSTGVLNGDGATYATAAALDAGVNTLSITNIVRALPTTATLLPTVYSGGFRHNNNVAGLWLQSRPTTDGTNAASIMLGTLQNTSGGDLASITISYLTGTNYWLAAELPGLRVYFSLTGLAGSWTVIPALSGIETNGTLTATVAVGTWMNTSNLYLLWADDNANSATDPSYTIDNFSVTPAGVITESVIVTNPANTSTFVQGVPITVNATATLAGTVTDVSFYHEGVLIGSDPTAPYSLVYSNATVGAHTLRAVATDSTHSVTSSIINITVITNSLSSIFITSPINGSNYFVGVTVTGITATATGTLAGVEFFVDGTLWATDTTSPYSFDLCDITAGTHALTAVAVNFIGGRTTNSLATNAVSITATNPAGITALVANGSDWKYLDNGSDQGAAWYALAFDDSSWSNGVAELGYGDGPGRPERTLVGFGPSANAKYPTTYFRKRFEVSNPGLFTNLIVRVLHDDHAIVYLNGTQVYNDMTNAVVSFATYELPAIPHDGTVYAATNASPSLLVAGTNIIVVEVHQDSTNSSDISFDLMLWGQGNGASAGPSLTVVRTDATHATVSWPNSASSYVLQGSVNLNSPANWTDIAGPYPTSGSLFVTNVNISSGLKFFQLRP